MFGTRAILSRPPYGAVFQLNNSPYAVRGSVVKAPGCQVKLGKLAHRSRGARRILNDALYARVSVPRPPPPTGLHGPRTHVQAGTAITRHEYPGMELLACFGPKYSANDCTVRKSNFGIMFVAIYATKQDINLIFSVGKSHFHVRLFQNWTCFLVPNAPSTCTWSFRSFFMPMFFHLHQVVTPCTAAAHHSVPNPGLCNITLMPCLRKDSLLSALPPPHTWEPFYLHRYGFSPEPCPYGVFLRSTTPCGSIR